MGVSESGARPRRPDRRGAATDAVPILVVDDDPGTLRHVRDTLTEAGYAPLVAGDPRELSRILRTEKPRLVLLDLMLPGTDGIQLMQTVPELADLPVIFISGYGRDETIARALEAGAEQHSRLALDGTGVSLFEVEQAAFKARAAPESRITSAIRLVGVIRPLTEHGNPSFSRRFSHQGRPLSPRLGTAAAPQAVRRSCASRSSTRATGRPPRARAGMVESARNHHQGLLPTPTSGDDEAAIQDTVGDDAATFTLTFNEVERHIACPLALSGSGLLLLAGAVLLRKRRTRDALDRLGALRVAEYLRRLRRYRL